MEAVDWDYLVSALALGLWQRPWEGPPYLGYEGLGLFDVEHFDPAGFSPHGPFVPFLLADPYDEYWAAKHMMRLTPAHIAAAIRAGKVRDPRAARELQRVLIGRQRKAARYAFARVNPVDDFAITDRGNSAKLCFRDLFVAYDLADASAPASHYSIRAFASDGHALAEAKPAQGPASGLLCADGLAQARSTAAYTIFRIDTWRGRTKLRPVEIHTARRNGSGDLRVIGVHRR